MLASVLFSVGSYASETSRPHAGCGLVFSKSGENCKPKIDCATVRGVCYRIESEAAARRHLAYGKRVGLNTVRFWMNPRHFAASGEEYIKRVVDFVRVCDACGYKSMPILFNGNMLDPETIMPQAYIAADRFTTAVVNALKDEPGLLMFDMMNEPLCNSWISKSIGDERKKRSGLIAIDCITNLKKT